MSPIRIAVSPEQLLQAAAQLAPRELDAFVTRLRALQACRNVPSLSEAESAVLLQINEGWPREADERYWALVAQRQADALAPGEYEELLVPTEQRERANARRVANLAGQARLRGVSLRHVLDHLGIHPPAPAARVTPQVNQDGPNA